jgi:hypothetical protein
MSRGPTMNAIERIMLETVPSRGPVEMEISGHFAEPLEAFDPRMASTLFMVWRAGSLQDTVGGIRFGGQ